MHMGCHRDIHKVLDGLTQLPILAISTHLHFDHTNSLSHFSSVAMIDMPEARSRMTDGKFQLGRYQVLSSIDGITPPAVLPVTEWLKPDDYIDLGERRVQMLWTPGHTATSISIYDPTVKLLFTGDLIYTTSLFAFMIDSSLSDYASTLDRLLNRMPPDMTVYGAHCCRSDMPPTAPWLSMNDLKDASKAVNDIRSGKAEGKGFLLRRFPVNRQMTLITFYPFGNR